MPLRDHFHPPLADRRPWDGLHGAWPTIIVMGLNRILPRRYVAEPLIHLGASIEIDVAALDQDETETSAPNASGSEGGTATAAVWAPPRPTLAVATDLPAVDTYEVRVVDTRLGRRLVAAVELVGPSNKDRPEHRRAFAAKCAGLLQNRVSVVVVDLVTSRAANLYGELLDLLGQTDPSLVSVPRPLYAAACRWARADATWMLETWMHPLEIGRPLPILPLWLSETDTVPLDLESSYEEACRILRIP